MAFASYTEVESHHPGAPDSKTNDAKKLLKNELLRKVTDPYVPLNSIVKEHALIEAASGKPNQSVLTNVAGYLIINGLTTQCTSFDHTRSMVTIYSLTSIWSSLTGRTMTCVFFALFLMFASFTEVHSRHLIA
uniref:RNase III domain-containing protein n=1 Tax=Steinernema glaseri TaxID=37863 RepID=A0A1I7Y4Z6_9BILA